MRDFEPVLLDIWREACRHIQLEESADRIFSLLHTPLGLSALAVYHQDGDAEFHLATSIGVRHAEFPGKLTVGDQRRSAYERWRAHGEPDLFSNAAFVAGGDGIADGDLIAPLSVEGTAVGMLVVRRGAGPDWIPEAVSRVSLLLEPFAVALTNDRRLREMKVLRETAEAERSTLLKKLGMNRLKQELVGADSGLADVLSRVNLVARTDTPVLIFGETGTGKEVIAREIHHQSARSDGPFLRVNCGAIPPGLIDSELFGHERGSFTGAHKTRAGWFERADGGTLFLDEIGELPAEAQVRLLRVLQDGHLERVGGHHEVGVNVRVVAATHRDLSSMVGSGEFRQDLWYRLAVFPIDLPPLRERKEDIPALARHFAQRAAHRFGLALKLPSESGLEALVEYDWPGNIRELAAVIDRAAILGDGRSLEVHAALGMATAGAPATTRGDSTDVVAHDEAVPRRTAPQGADTSDGFAAVGVDASAELAADELLPLDEVVRLHIERVVGAAGGRIEGAGGAAALLGMNPSTLRSKMRKLGIRR